MKILIIFFFLEILKFLKVEIYQSENISKGHIDEYKEYFNSLNADINIIFCEN